MDIRLTHFLQTGQLGHIQPGTSQEEIVQMLGPPHETGGTSRKYKRPNCFVYGSVEMFFTQHVPIVCTGITWYAHRGSISPTKRQAMSDWGKLPGMSQEHVEAYLKKSHLSFEYIAAPSITLQLPSGVLFVFHDNGLLYSLGIWDRN